MEREYRTLDRSTWPAGPWDGEADKVQWIDEATNLDCLAVRNDALGHWCGYVGVGPDHPAHGIEPDHADCHGGVTFTGSCQEGGDPSHGICHVPLPGRPSNVWWIGFDCAHLGDLVPLMPLGLDGRGGRCVYRTLAYVRGQCAELARSLRDG